MRTAALLLLSALAAPAATFYLTIAGLGGEPDYTQRFKMWADDIDGSLKKAGGDSSVTTLNAPHLEQIQRFPDVGRRPLFTRVGHSKEPLGPGAPKDGAEFTGRVSRLGGVEAHGGDPVPEG